MSNRKLRTPFIMLAALIGGSSLLWCGQNNKVAVNPQINRHNLNTSHKNAPDFSGEQEISSDDLSVAVTSSTLSSMGQSFALSFSTGGQGFQDATKTYLLAPKDDAFAEYFEAFKKLTPAQQEELEEQSINGERESEHFNAVVYSIYGDPDYDDIYIPTYFSRNSIFYLDVTEVAAGAVKDWTDIKKIYIPKSVTTIYPDSFENAPATVTFAVEGEEDGADWAAGWSYDAKVEYNSEIKKSKVTAKSIAGAPMYGDPNKNFYIGYYPENMQTKIGGKEYSTSWDNSNEYVVAMKEKAADQLNIDMVRMNEDEFVFSGVVPSMAATNIDKNTHGKAGDITLGLGGIISILGEAKVGDFTIIGHINFTAEELETLSKIQLIQLSLKTPVQHPLIAEYKVKKVDGTLSETKYFTFSKSKATSEYDAVGFGLISYTNSLYADIPLENDGEEIEFDTFKLHNIYPAVRDDESSPFHIDETVSYSNAPKKSYNRTFHVNDLITYNFKGISTFSGYTSIHLNFNQNGLETYKETKTSYYQEFEKQFEKGSAYIRYRVNDLTSCKYVFTYKQRNQSVTKKLAVETPVTQFLINKKKNNSLSFVIKNSKVGKGFSAKTIESLSFEGFYVTLDIFATSNGTKGKVARSNLTVRFGMVSIMPYTPKHGVNNLDLMVTLTSLIYAACYAALAVGLFFYLKNKYKNDEFRRMKPKSFIIKAILGLVGSLIVILAVMFVIFRTSSFANAIVVYNPVDAYIIIFGVLSVIIIGYFIKYLVGATKAFKQRRKSIKLKLDLDVDDDGTN